MSMALLYQIIELRVYKFYFSASIDSASGCCSVFGLLFTETYMSVLKITAETADEHNRRGRVLVVEDDEEISLILTEALQAVGFSCVVARTLIDAARELNSTTIDLITLDLSLGSTDGLKLLENKIFTSNIPTIIVTARGEDDDRILGLEFGAVDYITKPFHIKELVLRVKVAFNSKRTRADNALDYQILINDFILIDLYLRQVRTLSNESINLSFTEYQILDSLVCSPNRVLSRDDLYKLVFRREYRPFDRTLDGHVARLRLKINDGQDGRPQLIKSVRNIGYMLSGKVTRISPDIVH